MATVASTEDATPRWLVGRLPISTKSSDGSRPLTISEAKKLLSSYKGQITRDVNSGVKSIAFATALPSDEAVRSLEDVLHSVTYHREWVSVLVIYLSVKDDINAGDYETQLSLAQDSFEQCRLDVVTCMVATRKALAPAVVAPTASAPAAPGSTQKVIDSLKPSPLSRDASPVELNNWSEEFKAFYSASKLDRCTAPEQHAYLYKCLDIELASLVRLAVNSSTPMFGAIGSCFAILQKKFDETYPLYVRRLRFFQHSQTQGQRFDDFWTKLQQLANEADLNSLSTEDLLVFRIVGGCSDTLLREKFLQLSNPSLSDITTEAATWEGVRRSLATYDATPTSSVHKQSQDTVKKSQPRCPNCSSNQHLEGKSCPAKDKTCNICGKVGHFGRTRQGKLICRSAPADTPKTLDRRSQSRGRALTEAPPPTPDDQASVSSVQLAQ